MNDNDDTSDLAHMRRALDLAASHIGKTGDNPSVGCVIATGSLVIAEGVTGVGGRPHAEEIALSVAGIRARGADVFVTLEPCAQRSAGGRSCSELLAALEVGRVLIAARDPHPFANGAGVARLREAGVTVEIGLMEAEARAQNPDFFAAWDKLA